MPPDVRIEHRYPTSLDFLRRHGSEALAVLHVVLVRAEERNARLIAQVSTRDIAEELGFLSKDTVHRRLRQLVRAGVLERLDSPTGSTFAPTTYVVHLTSCGITVNRSLSTVIDDLPA